MNNNEIYLTDCFESFLKSIFDAQSFHQIAGPITKKEWADILLRLIAYIEKSIDNTIRNTDAEFAEESKSNMERIKQTIHNSKDLSELNEQTILGLLKTVRLLIGKIPDDYLIDNTSHLYLN